MVHGDGKFLADLVADWFGSPERMRALGLAERMVQLLETLSEEDYYTIRSEADIPWHDAHEILEALKAFRDALSRASETAAADRGPALSPYAGLSQDEDDLSDAIETCAWAAAHGRRVWLFIH